MLQLPLCVLYVQSRRLPLVLTHSLEEVERRHPGAAQEQGLCSGCVLDLDPLRFLRIPPETHIVKTETDSRGWGQ